MFAQWNESSKIGAPTIDHLHRELYTMLNDIKQAAGQELEVDVVAHVMNRLLPFINDHFEEESKELLADSPEYRDCCARHAQEKAMVQFFLRDKSPEQPTAAIDLINFLDSMLDGYIMLDRQEPGKTTKKLVQ